MKNLPDIFPIRYAIVTNDYFPDEGDDEFEKMAIGIRFKQLSKYLFKNPLTITSRDIHSYTLTLEQESQRCGAITKLDHRTVGGILEDFKELREGLANSGFYFGLTTQYGRAFNLIPISYRGLGEIPIFLQMYRHMDDRDYLKNKFGYTEHYPDSYYNRYLKLLNGEMDETALWDSLEYNSKPTYIQIPYSRLWSKLDEGFYDGVIPNHWSSKIKTKIENINENDFEDNHLVKVALCRNWDSLFLEEILSIYKSSKTCLNCGKSLPFGFIGKYCIEDIECKRSRDRQRQAKSQKRH